MGRQRIAVTGGTGFIGRRVVKRLRADGHDVVVLSRRTGFDIAAIDNRRLREALRGCDAIVHCAGINREIGVQTYEAVHVRATAALLEAARDEGVRRIALMSFLRARPDGPDAYHRSKWRAEELVRGSGLEFTIVKAGVVHGLGDHMLDHLSHALHTFPVFALVGMTDRPVRPVAVDDVARILATAANGDDRLAGGTFAVTGPEELTLGDAVRRVAAVVDRHPVFVRAPVLAHLLLARVCEATMKVPLVSRAQVRILAEGIVDAAPSAGILPDDLLPETPFSAASIRAGLPVPGAFGCQDLRWCRAGW